LNPVQVTYRLKSSEEIASLVKTGQSKVKYPIKVFYKANDQEGMRIAVVASKRLFKRAVDRNRIKRLLREAIRLELKNNEDLRHLAHAHLDLLLISVGKELPRLEQLKKSLAFILKHLSTA